MRSDFVLSPINIAGLARSLKTLGINQNGLATRETEPNRLVLVCIIGSKPALADACRVSLEHLCPAGYHIQECGSSDASTGCDIYIWDFRSSPSLPPAIVATDEATKLVIVDKSSLPSVRRKLPHSDFVYLHSPVTPLSLKVVLESAIARLQLRESSPRLNLDRDRILQQLLETNLKLRERDQDLNNFLARAIHDMRVPLMAIQGYCGLLLAAQMGPVSPDQARILERMQRSLTRLCRLVGTIMDLGTGSQVTTKPKLDEASIETCVQQAVHEILPFVEKKHITLNLEVELPQGTLLFDAGQLEQVLVNLLENACKFTPKSGAITVRGRSITAEGLGRVGLLEATAGYRIDIRDTGSGINPEHIEQIFDEHTSFDDSMGRSGSGLGLAICRMIIHAHNGRIWADSNTEGASFSFVLPLVRSFNDSHRSHVAV
jgi:signal transduction histidine kinase